jgi:hypothetical protein
MTPRLLSLALPWLLLAACTSTDSTYAVRFASGFSPARHTVSVFGVYKDGQMSAEAWDSLAPRLSSWLGAAPCGAGYVEGTMAKANAPIWAAVDEYTRSNGPTDDLLAEVAPAAQGDLVMVLTVAGKVPDEEKIKVQNESPQAVQGRGGLGSTRASGGAMLHNRSIPAGSKDALDLAALLYSVSAKQSVAQVSLEYSGHSLDEALTRFTAKLRDSLPGAVCAGWAWEGRVDAERIRKLGD